MHTKIHKVIFNQIKIQFVIVYDYTHMMKITFMIHKSEQIRENPFIPPESSERLLYWTAYSYTQGEPKIATEPIDFSFDTKLSSLPETLSLPSTPSKNLISPTICPLNFSTNLDARYQEQPSTNTPYD